jgi:hypothetical protein
MLLVLVKKAKKLDVEAELPRGSPRTAVYNTVSATGLRLDGGCDWGVAGFQGGC